MSAGLNVPGLIVVKSGRAAADTLDQLQAAIRSAGMSIFATFDHAEAAKEAGLALRPTTVIAFGNPAAGTNLMQVNQVIGIDLPLKILVWEDESKITQIAYNDPRWLAERHALGTETDPVIAAMSKLLDSIVQKVAKA